MPTSRRLMSHVLPILFCFTFLLAACSFGPGPQTSATPTAQPPTSTPQGSPSASADKQIFRSPLFGSDIQMDPALAGDQQSVQVTELAFTGLVELDDHLNVRPQLAQSWEVGPDGLTWTFHLKPNLKFSDGTPLTSQDVVYSIDRALQPATQSITSLSFLAIIKDSEKLHRKQTSTIIGDSLLTPDRDTVVVITNRKAAFFLADFTAPCSFVVEKKLIDKYGPNFIDHLNEGGGAGPFIVSKYIHGQEIDFTPNQNYNGPKAQLQKVVYTFYQDDGNTYQAYHINQLDMTPIPLDKLSGARNTVNEFHQVLQLTINYYTMNYLRKPFDNIHIRQAFALAVDRDSIAHNVWQDTLVPTWHIIPQGMQGYNPDLTGPDGVTSTKGDPAKAKQLLQQGLHEEGWDSVAQIPPIKITYSGVDDEFKADAQQWQSILGINVSLDPVDYNTLQTEVQGAFRNPNGLQMWAYGWVADYPDAQDWTTVQFDKASPQNLCNYGQNNSSNASEQIAVQKQLQAADINQDTNTRMLAYQQAEQALVNDVAWIPMFQQANIYLLKPYVQGLVINGSGLIPPDDWGHIYITAH